MGKKLIDVEDLMVWVASELSRKRPANVIAPPVFDVARADREIVGKWTRPMGYPPMSPMFAPGLARAGGGRGDPPHADALIVEEALQRLRLGPEWAPDRRYIAADLGFALDVEAAIAAAFANARNLVLVHGRLGSRPSVTSEPCRPQPRLAPNGKPGVWRKERWREYGFGDRPAERELEVACAVTRKGVYPEGAYGGLVYEPDPQAIVNERAEYAAWRLALCWLATELEGALETRAALAPRAAARPWLSERDGDPVADPFKPGEEVYGPAGAASLAAERETGRRRTLGGGRVYSARPIKPAKGMREA